MEIHPFIERLCEDDAFAALRTRAVEENLLHWERMRSAIRNPDRDTGRDQLAQQLREAAPDQGALDMASMHARICRDCESFEEFMDTAAAAAARQAVSWYGFWASMRRGPGAPTTAEHLTRWADTLEAHIPGILPRLPAALEALV